MGVMRRKQPRVLLVEIFDSASHMTQAAQTTFKSREKGSSVGRPGKLTARVTLGLTLEVDMADTADMARMEGMVAMVRQEGMLRDILRGLYVLPNARLRVLRLTNGFAGWLGWSAWRKVRDLMSSSCVLQSPS
jgi:hypothetical protein